MPEPATFRRIYTAESSYVLRVLQRFGARGADVEDLAHEVFVTAYRRWDTYDSTRAIRPWLFGIAFRVFSDFRRKVRHHAEQSDSEGVERHADERSLEDLVARSQARELVLQILETFPLERRALFVMHELEGLPIPEIAEALSIPLNTAYSRLRLARQDFNVAVKLLQEREVSHGV